MDFPLAQTLGATSAAKPVASPKPAPLSNPLAPAPDVAQASKAPLPAMRDFDDTETMRTLISDNVVGALKEKYPLENSRYRLELHDVDYLDKNPFTLDDQKRAIMRGQTLARRLGGTWKLYDKTSGSLIDQKGGVIAHVPYATERGTFIYQGSEYTISNQMRLKPGVFTRVKENGLLEAHVNVKGGTGPSFRVYMEPDTGIFRLGVGQSTLKLYPILKAMGVDDREIEGYWGKDLLSKNIEAEDPRAVARAMAKLVNTRAVKETSETATENPLEKAAEYIGARESNRKWTHLWFKGKLRCDDSNPEKPWVYLEVHKGLCEAAYDSLKGEGVECEPKYENPHISVILRSEALELIKKHKHTWKSICGDGTKMRFRITKIVNLVPAGWTDKFDRVWFLEALSPDLCAYREALGLSPVPIHGESGNHQRFHITFAVHRNTARKAAALLCDAGRSALSAGDFEGGGAQKAAAGNPEGTQLKGIFDKMELDEDVTEATLGSRFKTVGTAGLLRTSQKLLNINQGKEETDDRDSLAFQTLHGPEDFFAERIRKDAGQIGKKILWKSTLRGNLKALPSGALTPQLNSVLLKSGMGMALEETNPMDIHDQVQRVIRLGEGGIPNTQSVPDEARNVQPSQFGFIDPVRGPECHDELTEVMTEQGWKLWKDLTSADKLACLLDGRVEFHQPERLVAEPYAGPMYGAQTKFLDFLVTPGHRMYVRPQSSKGCQPLYRFETPGEMVQKNRLFLCGGHVPVGGACMDFTLPSVQAEGTDRQVAGNPPIGASLKNHTAPIPIKDWCEFLGWYLSEGSLNGPYVVRLSQCEKANPENCKKIAALLDRLPFTWCFLSGDTFTISSKQLNAHLQQFGFCDDKFIPPEVFEAPVEAKQAFVQALLDGDGRKDPDGQRRSLCTSSARLSADFERLAFQLGYATGRSFEADTRKETYLGCHVICLHRTNERLVVAKSARHPDGQYRIETYSGKVYCATVPGGLLYTRRNGSVGCWSGNSDKIGIDTRVAWGVKKGSDGQFYRLMRNKEGALVPVSNSVAAKSIVAFPGEMAREGNKVRAMSRAKQIMYVDKGEVDYELPSANHMFSVSSSLVPMISGIKGGRLLMGAKYVVQSLPLRTPEAPLVQSMAENGKSFDEIYGEKVGAIRAKSGGRVVKMDGKTVQVLHDDGTTSSHQLYTNFPFNRKTFIHNTPLVKVDDRVEPGQLLAKSNYTDDTGTMAIGTNLKVAYMPYKGLNYEDAIVISEGAAKKLASEHMYQHFFEKDDNKQISRKDYVSMFPTKFNRQQLSVIDDNGVIKPGTRVKQGDPLMLVLNKAQATAVHRAHKPMFADGAMTWDHSFDGEVTDVDQVKGGGYNITVKAYAPAKEGDKLAGRYGDKGVIARIIPDDQMPAGQDGNPYEILLNPLGIITRGNPSQVFETLLGKIARKRGQPYKVDSFSDEALIDRVEKELKAHGLSDTEDLFDPTANRKVPKVLTGERFIFKLHHTAESKGKGRGDHGAYTSEGIPAKGGDEGAKRISNMEINALLSHGVTEVIRDAKVVRGQKNDDYWRAFRMGYNPPSPKVPMVYQKFLGYLQGSGINLQQSGDKTQLFAMTDKDIEKISSGALKAKDTVENDSLAEIPGGLFDRSLTGGHGGGRWTHIELSEPIPNPIMEEPIRRLLGMTGKKFEAVLSGRESLNGKVGGEAIKDALSKINLDSSIEYYERILKDGAKSKRDNAVKVLSYLRQAKKHDLRPEDWVISKVPVLPPNFRPITTFNGMTHIGDANYLYRDLMHANEVLGELKGRAGAQGSADERLAVYKAFQAVSGLGDPIQAKTQEKKVKGLLSHVFGSSPKLGMFQRRVLGMPVDVVGRASITPNPDLDMDQVGIPEAKAWTIYRPFVVRRLIRAGMPATEAAKAAANQNEQAKKALMEEIQARPVLINRAPTLHRYGFMAAWPVLTKGDTLQISPVVTPGFNADFDGDAMNYHVPATDEAVKEAIERMMPSRNLKNVRDFKTHYVPRNEFLMGLYLASTAKKDKGEPRVFRSKKDVAAAWKRGELDLGDPIKVMEE